MSDSAVITLLTGLPGNGKTLSLVDRLDGLSKQGIPLFVHGIPGLKVPHTVLDDPERWYEVPTGSIVVIDEAQKVFPVRAGTQAPPAKVAAFQTLRHKGLKAYLVTQHPKLIDSAVRELIGAHFHYERLMGMDIATQFEWPHCVVDPRAGKARKSASKTTYFYPKRVYGLYQSAEEHNVKVRIPKVVKTAAMVFVVAALAMAGGAYFLKHRTLSGVSAAQGSVSSSQPSISHPVSAAPQASNSQHHVMTRDEYVAAYTPRFPGFPNTAPAYDELSKPTVAPKPVACVASKTSCKCYTQQATLIPTMPQGLCRDIAENGYFDDTQKPIEPNGPTSQEVRAGGAPMNVGDVAGDSGRPGSRNYAPTPPGSAG